MLDVLMKLRLHETAAGHRQLHTSRRAPPRSTHCTNLWRPDAAARRSRSPKRSKKLPPVGDSPPSYLSNEVLRKAFAAIDADRNGLITRDALMRAIASRSNDKAAQQLSA